MSLTPNEYQRLSQKTRCPQHNALARIAVLDVELYELAPEPDASRIPANAGAMFHHGAIGLAGEAGEIVYAVEKYAYYERDFDRANVLEELGDALWYIAEMCDALGTTMEHVMELNIQKLQNKFGGRYSTGEFQHEHANQRDLNAERRILEDGTVVGVDRAAPGTTDKTVTQVVECGNAVTGEPEAPIANTDAVNDVTPEVRERIARTKDQWPESD